MSVDENTAGPYGPQQPLYIQPNSDGTHQIIVNGQIHDLPFGALTQPLQMQALSVAQNPSDNPNQLPPGTDASIHPLNALRSIFAPSGAQLMNYGVDPETAEKVAEAPPQAQPAAKPQQISAQVAADETQAQTPMAPSADQVLGKATTAPTGGGGGTGSNKQYADAQKLEEEGIASTRDITQEEAAQNLAILNQQQADESTARQAHDLKMAAIQQQANDVRSKAVAAADRFQNATIDPNSMWHSRTTGEKNMAGLAMILSGIGSGATGGVNLAVKSMDDAQNRDLETQKFNIQHNKEASEQYRALYQDFRQAGMDETTAFDATNAAIKYRADQDNRRVVLAHGDARAVAAYDMAMAGSRKQQVKDVAEITARNAATAASNASTANSLSEIAARNIQNANLRDLKAGQQNLSNHYGWEQLPPEQQRALIQNAQGSKMLIPGVGIATREVSAADQDKAQDIQTARDLLRDLAKDTKGVGAVWSPAAASKAQALKIILPKVLGSQARINEGAQAALDNVVSGSKVLPGWEQGEKQKALKSTLGEIEKNFHNSLGVTKFQTDRTEEQAKAGGAVAVR
jgi:hypothetical protein